MRLIGGNPYITSQGQFQALPQGLSLNYGNDRLEQRTYQRKPGTDY